MQKDQSFHSLPTIQDHQSILNRLSRIEAALGIAEDADYEASQSREATPEEDPEAVELQGVWTALAHLRVITRPPPDENGWSRPVVKQLWRSYVLFAPGWYNRHLTAAQLLGESPASSLSNRPRGLLFSHACFVSVCALHIRSAQPTCRSIIVGIRLHFCYL
jgi:hypothetical protein